MYKLTGNELFIMQYIWMEEQNGNNDIKHSDVIKKFSVEKGWSRPTITMLLKRLKAKSFITTNNLSFNPRCKSSISYDEYCNTVIFADSDVVKHWESYEAIINFFNTIKVTDEIALKLKGLLNE